MEEDEPMERKNELEGEEGSREASAEDRRLGRRYRGRGERGEQSGGGIGTWEKKTSKK